ncbi:hypothetical protein OSTOST_15172 [Ostertagia ostertagi]
MLSLCSSSNTRELTPPPSYAHTTATVIPIEEPIKRIHAKTLKSNDIKLEWIPFTTTHIATYSAVAVIALVYNGVCFAHNYGRMPLAKQNIFDDIFGEEALLYSVCMQWLLIFSIFLAGITLERCILATNGNAVLFVINIKKVADNVISRESRYFIFVSLLFGLSLVLCIVYLTALAYYRKEKRYYRSMVLSSTTFQLKRRYLAEEAVQKFYPSYPYVSGNPVSLSPIIA